MYVNNSNNKKQLIGFLPHPNKTGWHPNDLKYEYASNNPFITQEEYLESIN